MHHTELFPLGFLIASPNTEEIRPAPLTSSKHERQRWVLFSKDLNSICTLFYEDISWTYRHTHVRVGDNTPIH